MESVNNNLDLNFRVNFKILCGELIRHNKQFTEDLAKINKEADIWLLMGPSGCGKTTAFIRLTTDVEPEELRSAINESKRTRKQVEVMGSIIGASGTSTTICPNPKRSHNEVIIDLAGFETDESKSPIVNFLNSSLIGSITHYKILLFMELGSLKRGEFSRYRNELIKIFGEDKFNFSTENLILVITKIKDNESSFREYSASQDDKIENLIEKELFSQLKASRKDPQLSSLIGAACENFCLLECQTITREEAISTLNLSERKVSDLNPQDLQIDLTQTQNRISGDGKIVSNYLINSLSNIRKRWDKFEWEHKSTCDGIQTEIENLEKTIKDNEIIHKKYIDEKERMLVIESGTKTDLESLNNQKESLLSKLTLSKERDEEIKREQLSLKFVQIIQIPSTPEDGWSKKFKINTNIKLPLGTEKFRVVKTTGLLPDERLNELSSQSYEEIKVDGITATASEIGYDSGIVKLNIISDKSIICLIICQINCDQTGYLRLFIKASETRTHKLGKQLRDLEISIAKAEMSLAEIMLQIKEINKNIRVVTEQLSINDEDLKSKFVKLKELESQFQGNIIFIIKELKTLNEDEIWFLLREIAAVIKTSKLKATFLQDVETIKLLFKSLNDRVHK